MREFGRMKRMSASVLLTYHVLNRLEKYRLIVWVKYPVRVMLVRFIGSPDDALPSSMKSERCS